MFATPLFVFMSLVSAQELPASEVPKEAPILSAQTLTPPQEATPSPIAPQDALATPVAKPVEISLPDTDEDETLTSEQKAQTPPIAPPRPVINPQITNEITSDLYPRPTYPSVSTPRPYVAPFALPKDAKSVKVESYTRNYEAPKDEREILYDANLSRALQEKQSQMGSLEGGWFILNEDSEPVLSLELRVQRGQDSVSGAWRAIKPKDSPQGGLSQSGFVSNVELIDEKLVISYYEKRSHSLINLSLTRADSKTWNGTMKDAAGNQMSVTMKHK